MSSGLASLLRRIVGGNDTMPHFREIELANYNLKLRPNDRIRRFCRDISLKLFEIPYFYGSDIYFDLQIITPKNKNMEDRIEYDWQIKMIDQENPMRSGRGAFHFSAKMSKKRLFSMHKEKIVIERNYVFIKNMAIHIGYLSKLAQYQLLVNIADDRGNREQDNIMAEFTLQDRDAFYKDVANLAIGAIFGAVFGVIVTFFAFIFFRGNI